MTFQERGAACNSCRELWIYVFPESNFNRESGRWEYETPLDYGTCPSCGGAPDDDGVSAEWVGMPDRFWQMRDVGSRSWRVR